MPSKVYAIAPDSAKIALKYDKTVSKGIAAMEDKITRMKRTEEIERNDRERRLIKLLKKSDKRENI